MTIKIKSIPEREAEKRIQKAWLALTYVAIGFLTSAPFWLWIGASK